MFMLHVHMIFKGSVHPKFSLDLLPPVPMESLLPFGICSPQNISGALQQNSVAAFSLTTEVDGNFFWNSIWNACYM